MDSVAQKIDFSLMSDDDLENGAELSINSMSSGCDADEFKTLSPAGGSPRCGPEFQAPRMTSSPRRAARPAAVRQTPRPAPLRPAGRPARDRHDSASPSPPYKRIKGEPPLFARVGTRFEGLNLGDAPCTPRTLMKDSMMPPWTPHDINSNSLPSRPDSRKVLSRTRYLGRASAEKETRPAVNVNPFTPRGRLINERKRLRDSGGDSSMLSVDCSTDEGDLEDSQPTKRLALADANVSRLEKEFVLQHEVGSGEFGEVYRCIHRLDGCVYAIKRSKKPVAGSSQERSALNEVYAHAVLGKHQYIVRYYSAWAENNRMLIQNEFCTRGSLAALLDRHRADGTLMSEAHIKRMVTHVARGLRYIHSMQLCHLDLKPGNIFVTDNELFSGERRAGSRMEDDASVVSSDDGFDEDDEDEDEVIYKIGDLGHVTSLAEPQVEEGDCRYMPREILNENYSCLTKADMFALGLTAYECASGQPLPKNGELWHRLRDGLLPPLAGFSDELHQLIQVLIDPESGRRPSAAELLAHPCLLPASCRNRAQLRRQLHAERLQNQLLRSQLADLSSPERAAAAAAGTPAPRLIGRGTPRSRSTTF